jgi:hypothetical protein
VTPLIALLKKPKTIMSRVDLVVFAKALNVAFLALTLLKVRAKALLKSFLALVIRLLPFS